MLPSCRLVVRLTCCVASLVASAGAVVGQGIVPLGPPPPIRLALWGGVQLPSYPLAGLPASGVVGRLARVQDALRGMWMDTGSQWWRLDGNAVDVAQFGALGDGLADDTAAVQQALDAGAATVLFGAGHYRLSSLSVPSDVRLIGAGATIHPLGAPAQVFAIDASSSPREHVIVQGFAFDGNASQLVHVIGPAIFCELRDLRVIGGTGTAVVRFHNDSAVQGSSRNVVSGIDARVSGWSHAVLIDRGPVALAAGIGFDDFVIERISHWAGTDVVNIRAPCSQTRISQIYGGLFAEQNQSVVHVDPDAGFVHHLDIGQIYMETWMSGAVAVRLRNVEFSTITSAEANRISPTLFGVRALHGTGVRACWLANPIIKDVGQSPADSPPGYYPALELDATSRDNTIAFLDLSQVNNRILDAGLRNRVLGDKNDAFLVTENDRVTLTGTQAETTLKELTLAAGSLGPRDGLRITATGTVSGGLGAKTLRFLWGGQPLSGSTLSFGASEGGSWHLEATLWGIGTAQQRCSFVEYKGGTFATHAMVTTNVDTTQPTTFEVTGRLDAGADVIAADAFLVEPIRKVSVP